MTLSPVMLALSLACLPCTARSDDAADIRRALTERAEAFNRRDADAACRLFAPDLLFRFRGHPVRSKAEICAQLSKALADEGRRLTYEAEIEEIIVSGDLAAVRLVWTLTARRGGEERVSREPGLDLFRRQPDGVWRISRFLAYSEDRDE
jgi:uncharacterized protein (TIGR02246 family)